MDTALRDEAKRIFNLALGLAGDERSAFIEKSCRNDAMKREVTSLLGSHDSAGSFFEDLGDGIIPKFENVNDQDSREAVMEAPDRLVGRTISHYKIISKLGGGGMGVVYKARNEKLGRNAALKFLSPGLSTDDVARARFAVEAKAASSFDHPNICTIYDIDQTDGGQVYIAMAYYDGETLKAKLADGPLDVETALDYATQMAEGLSRAHSGDIVHRDVKPANIMITREGIVKIVDFGVAKMGDTAAITESGTTVGTMAYMSPEQLQGQVADHRADIWSVGCVLHEMLTGERPFHGAYPQAVIYAILNGQRTAATEYDPRIPQAVEDIISRCLQKETDRRYQTTASLFADLYRARREVAETRALAQDSDRGRRLTGSGASVDRARIFISYNRGLDADERIAGVLSEALGENHDIFLDKVVAIGSKWIERLESELARADYLIVLISAESVHSEMVLGEIEMAHRLAEARDGRPQILPVRINYKKAFTYPLSHYLNQLNWAGWYSEADDGKLVNAIASAIEAGGLEKSGTATMSLGISGDTEEIPLPPASAQPSRLEMPEGTMDPHSRFYVARPEDDVALEAAVRQGVTLTIKGPRQMGKSSLLMRTMAAAARAGKEVVFLDFQLFDKSALDDAETFFRQFCTWLTDELDVEDKVEEYWRRPLGHSQRCTRYVGRHLLKETERPVFLGLDEVERVFDTSFRSDFFGMLRSWHNDRAIKPAWRNLDLALVTSTEPYQLIENLNQSPFNVGEVVELRDFSPAQVATLNEKHGAPLDETQLANLVSLLNGHPYLTRKSLFLVAGGRMTAEELLKTAADEHGPFGDHLRYHLFRLHGQSDLSEGFRQVLATKRCSDETVFWRLRGAGLVRRSTGNQIVARCRLYDDYFKEHLDA